MFALGSAVVLLSGCITIVIEESADDKVEEAAPDPFAWKEEPPGGQGKGAASPSIGLATQSSATDSDQWTITVTGATVAPPVTEYLFLLTVNGASESSRWRTDPLAASIWYEDSRGKPSGGASDGAYFDVRDRCYQVQHIDIAGDGKLGVGDRLVLRMESGDCSGRGLADADFRDDMYGRIELELHHVPSKSKSGGIDRAF